MPEKFEASFESLKNYECPDWFRNVKFGIWSHWGPQSVPMCGDWYARNMYIQGSEQYNYHVRHYGHPSEFGYLDICKLFQAEKFDPEGLMDLYYKAGARYFVAQAMHHDNYFNYASKVNRYNSVNIGPGKDICGMWKAAADKYHMPFGLTEHLGASFSWWHTNKGADTYGPKKGIPYDGNKKEHEDFYHANQEHILSEGKMAQWLTGNKKFQKYWLDTMKELTDLYHPDLLYSDSGLPFEEEGYQPGLEAVVYLYNDSMNLHGKNQAVYNQKNRAEEIYRVGVLDIEKSQLDKIQEKPWQTDTCIGNWFYDAKQTYKRPEQIIEMLVDIISKNGTMLLNVLQRPDGTIDEEARFILKELGKWFEICGEAVYDTRPFRVFGEGDTRVLIEGFKEEKTQWNSSDYRFTAKKGILYAFILEASENRVAVIKTLKPEEKVTSVDLLGHGPVEFAQNYGILTVKLPEQLPTIYTNCLKINI
ncbi:alpha-L-fucosidase [Anaerocolumna sp. AGMB13025]|uniref:alpha-L-fucosidase n=1 Tax=Anaerocolumna sp. AGMB13025 TaxID=3039116 RepID=UPI00241C59D4|nr:alpha-L-fucosidase [Anaerocolumna sp. AGMB13025]WFR58643.1 alpha-L-fucosidase [Anaerocolumna sp. AGMB13025]